MVHGYSGNLLHQFIDRGARKYRSKHREVVGHKIEDLLKMLFLFNGQYSQKQIVETWFLHMLMDNWQNDLAQSVRKKNSNYGKKHTESDIDKIRKLMRQL